MNPPSSNPPSADREILITRTFKAPRELVWQAWTNPEHLKHWHAPHGCDIHFERFDFRVGGGFHSCIHNPSYGDCWCLGVYQEIVSPERLVYTLSIADAKGNLAEPAEVGDHHKDWPIETTVTITLTERDGETELTLRQNVSEALARRTGAYPSWLEMLDRLAENVDSRQA